MRASLVALAIAAVAVLILLYSAVFIVNPTQQALVLRFGEVRTAIRDPGLNFKLPLVEDVMFLDKRILDLDTPTQEIIAADQKRLVVDAFARYRIENPVLFFQSVNNVAEGSTRLATFLQSALRAVLAEASFEQIVRDDRPGLMERIRLEVEARAAEIGMQVIDVRIRRADLPEANSQAIYRRMQTERQQEATQIRARGAEAAQRIRALADRTGLVIRAEANRESEQIRGDGDARRNEIFAAAYTRDPQFFSFYRSMQAYQQGLRPEGTRLIISPNSDFFRYFNDPQGTSPISRGRSLEDVGPVPGAPPAVGGAPAPAPAGDGEEAASAGEPGAATREEPGGPSSGAGSVTILPAEDGADGEGGSSVPGGGAASGAVVIDPGEGAEPIVIPGPDDPLDVDRPATGTPPGTPPAAAPEDGDRGQSAVEPPAIGDQGALDPARPAPRPVVLAQNRPSGPGGGPALLVKPGAGTQSVISRPEDSAPGSYTAGYRAPGALPPATPLPPGRRPAAARDLLILESEERSAETDGE